MEETKLIRPGQLYEVLPDGRWAVFFDSSSIRTFLDCEAMYQLRYVQRVYGRGRSWKTEIGSWWSHTMEMYYNALRVGDCTLPNVMEYALHAWDEKRMDDFVTTQPASYEEFGGRQGAVIMVGEYFKWAMPLDSRYWKIIAVEEGAGRLRELKVAENDKVVVYYIVKPDLFIIENEVLLPVDHKTKDSVTSRLIHDYKPRQQMMGYIVAGQELANKLGISTTVDRCIMNIAARNQPGPRAKRQERYTRFPVHYSVAELHEWRLRMLNAGTRIRHCFETNEWQWNDNACHVYGGCTYRPIHSVPPDSRLIVIKSAYNIEKPWVPYSVDGEE